MSRRTSARERSRGTSRGSLSRHRRQKLLSRLLDCKRRLRLEPLEKRLLLVGEPLISGVSPLPANGGNVSAAIDQLTVSLSEDLNATTANDINNWKLESAGGDNSFGTADDQTLTLSLTTAYVSGTEVSLDIDGRAQVLQPGQYRFTASENLTDLDGNKLDGNNSGGPGGDFVTTFTVAAAPGEAIEDLQNDSIGLGDALSMVETPAGRGYLRGFGMGSMQTGSDVDYWTFSALAGDRVAISVATPDSSLNPQVHLRNAADGTLTSNTNSGADNDAFVSFYTISSSGTYSARVSSE